MVKTFKMGNGIQTLTMAFFIDLHIYWSLATKCGLSQITIEGKHSETCLDCIECPPGMGSIPQCGSFVKKNVTVTCKACVEGVSYSDARDHTSCKSCRQCVENEDVIKDCTPTSDTQCGKCKPGYYRSFMYSCEKCSRCCEDSSVHNIEQQCLDQGFARERACQYTGRNCGEMKPTSFIQQSTTSPSEEREKMTYCTRSVIIIVVFAMVIILISWMVIILLCLCDGRRMKRYQRERFTTSYPVQRLINHIELGNNVIDNSQL